MHRLVYVSRNRITGRREMIRAEVGRILASSRRNNEAVGVTGALLFNASCYAQVLEGRMADIEAVFERIQRDPRHDNVVVLSLDPVGERGFSAWSMGFAGEVAVDRIDYDALGGGAAASPHERASAVVDLLRGLMRHDPPPSNFALGASRAPALHGAE